jgi:hypothetical protein
MIVTLLFAGVALPIVSVCLMQVIAAIRGVREDNRRDQEIRDYLVSFDSIIAKKGGSPAARQRLGQGRPRTLRLVSVDPR